MCVEILSLGCVVLWFRLWWFYFEFFEQCFMVDMQQFVNSFVVVWQGSVILVVGGVVGQIDSEVDIVFMCGFFFVVMIYYVDQQIGQVLGMGQVDLQVVQGDVIYLVLCSEVVQGVVGCLQFVYFECQGWGEVLYQQFG